MKVKFLPLDYDYVDYKGGAIVRIWGRTEEGKRICVIDSAPAYFWAIPHEDVDIKKYADKILAIKTEHANRIARVTDAKIKDKKFMGKDVKAVQVFVSNPKDITAIKDLVKDISATKDKKEIDINFVTRYIIEKEVKPLTWQTAEGKEILDKEYGDPDVDIILEAKSIAESQDQPDFSPNSLAFDIETEHFEIGKGKILMISLANKDVQKVITWKHFKDPPKEVEFVKDEAELIEKFVEFVHKNKPEVLTGYFSDGFDLPYLRARADKYKIKLNLGLDGSNVALRGGAVKTAEIRGVVHVDLFKFIDNIISPTLQSETVRLNDVAKELLGDEKVKVDLNKLMKELKATKGKLEDIELRKFSLYSLQDSVLTARLFDYMWPSISELTKVINEPLFDVSRAAYSQLVEDYIIHNLKQFNEIAENRPTREKIEDRRRARYAGGFVFQPEAGLYEDIVVFDFLSLYPSIISSFNISPATITESTKNTNTSPVMDLGGKKAKFNFEKGKSFIPALIEQIIEARKKIKSELKKKKSPILEARSYALKTLGNATYGYYAFFGARYYSVESAASITAFGRDYIQKVIEDATKSGFKVIYADTDSVVIVLGNKTHKDALEWQKKINDSLPGTMELDLEKFYKRGIFVLKRTGEAGAKKKYALLGEDGAMKIRGFESVRRDRCPLAKKTQDHVLQSVLEEGKPDSALKQVKSVLDEVIKGKAKTEELVIRTQLTRDIESYSSIGPHVEVAKRMREMGIPIGAGSLIEYVVVKGKEKLIRERARLPDEVEDGQYDPEYYIDNQIMPPIEGIFAVFGITKDQLTELKKQKKLMDF